MQETPPEPISTPTGIPTETAMPTSTPAPTAETDQSLTENTLSEIQQKVKEYYHGTEPHSVKHVALADYVRWDNLDREVVKDPTNADMLTRRAVVSERVMDRVNSYPGYKKEYFTASGHHLDLMSASANKDSAREDQNKYLDGLLKEILTVSQ